MKKIMFNDKYGLTQAVLEGRKTQTRRICAFGSNTYEKAYRNLLSNYKDGGRYNNELLKCSTYKVGEKVAVAQRYLDFRLPNGDVTKEFYKMCCENYMPLECLSFEAGAKNKMFVLADLMPHRIKITKVRVERLQDISDEDCLKEGIEKYNGKYTVLNAKNKVEFYCDNARLAFKYLIDKTCGRGTWDSNPYVFVYDFELIK